MADPLDLDALIARLLEPTPPPVKAKKPSKSAKGSKKNAPAPAPASPASAKKGSRVGSSQSKPSKKSIDLKEAELVSLCARARDIFLSQPALLELTTPLKIVADLHGQLDDLLRFFQLTGFPPESNYLFLGNYIHYGRASIDLVILLFAFKIKYSENFFLLRGNHECALMSKANGFMKECKQRFNLKVYKAFVECFDSMPLVAIVDDKIFCCHGGLSPDLQCLEQIQRIKRPCDVPDHGLLCDLLWSNPVSGLAGWKEQTTKPTKRGAKTAKVAKEPFSTLLFGADVLTGFLRKHNLDLMVRGNQVMQGGYDFFNERQLVTVFSAPNFKGEEDNAGAVMEVDETLLCSFQTLKAS